MEGNDFFSLDLSKTALHKALNRRMQSLLAKNFTAAMIQSLNGFPLM
jgi:hypothetical protein